MFSVSDTGDPLILTGMYATFCRFSKLMVGAFTE